MTVQKLTTGEATVTMSRKDYEDLVDSRDYALAVRDITSGNMPLIGEDEVDDYLAAPTPLVFWRKRRGMTQAHLAEAAGISQPFMAQIEGGLKDASAAVYARLARQLGVRIDDLVVD